MKKINDAPIVYKGESLNALVIKDESVEKQSLNLQKFIDEAHKTLVFIPPQSGDPIYILYGQSEPKKPCFRLALAPKFIFTHAVLVQAFQTKEGLHLTDTDLILESFKEGITFYSSLLYNSDVDIFKEQKEAILKEPSKGSLDTTMIYILNDGKEILDTNYYESERSLKGKFAISCHDKTFRILLPVSGEDDNLVGEIGKIQSIAISQNRDKMWEIMFDDRSDAPLALTFTETSFLGIIPRFKWDDGWVDLFIYQKGKKVFERKAYLRSINEKIPYLRELGDLEKV